MSDGLPTEDQLRRIERGVQRRIDARRRVAQRIAGATAGLVLLGGGLALVVPLTGTGSAAGGGSMAQPAAEAASAAPETVQCHDSSARDSAATTADVPGDADPQTVAAACGSVAVDFQSRAESAPSAAASAADAPAQDQDQDLSGQSATAPPAVLCRATDGVLHLFPVDAAPDTLCSRNGMTLW